MAIIHGRNAAVYLADNAATVRNISAFCDNVDMSWDIELADSSTFGTTIKTYVTGMRDHTFSLAGKWDSAATATPDEYMTGLAGHATPVQFTIFPGGSAAGAVYHRGSAIQTKYSVTTPLGGVVAWKADFQITGGITRATA